MKKAAESTAALHTGQAEGEDGLMTWVGGGGGVNANRVEMSKHRGRTGSDLSSGVVGEGVFFFYFYSFFKHAF